MKCAYCSKEADKSCSGCKNVNYCSVEHQKADWKTHKKVCAPYSVSVKDGVKVLTLRKNVPQGTILLDEAPILHIPESNGIAVDSICLVCGLHMIPLIAYRCSVCRWPVCGSDCESHPMHKENECKIFTSSKMKYEPKMLNELANIIIQTRALTIKATTPNIWNDLNGLLPGTTPYDDDWNVKYVGEYRKFIKKLLPNSDEKERKRATQDALALRKVLERRAFYINAQDVMDSNELTRFGKWRAGFYVYKKASLAKHSCASNCVWNISNFPDFKIRLRAAIPLKKGQVLSINHLEHHAEGQKGTVDRRIGHFSRFGHICMCDRCMDPTEFGTYISAVVCMNCRGPNAKNKVDTENLGYLLPENNPTAIGIKGSLQWRCNACRDVIPLSKIYSKIDKITDELEANDGKSIHYIPVDAENIARNLIMEYRDTFLHPNHWLIQRATLILIDNGYQDLSCKEKSPEDLLAHCEFILKILDQLYPGLSTLKSKVTLSLTGTIAAQMNYALSKAENDNESRETLLHYTGKLLRLKEGLLSFYQDDVPLERGSVTSEMGEMVEKDVIELRSILAMVDSTEQNTD